MQDETSLKEAQRQLILSKLRAGAHRAVVHFTKKDGSDRRMVLSLDHIVEAGEMAGERMVVDTRPNFENQCIVWDEEAQALRTVNLDTVRLLKVDDGPAMVISRNRTRTAG